MDYQPRILIMVLSYNEYPYDLLMKTQMDTWDAMPHDSIRTLYYYGAGDVFKSIPVDDASMYCIASSPLRPWSQSLGFYCSDDYYKMHWKFKLALDHALAEMPEEWDIIFRTNSSSYVNKKRLFEFAKTLPSEKLYAGWTMNDTNHDGGDCVSGAGIFLSKDCAHILSSSLEPDENVEEDVLIGRILRSNNIKAIDDKQRVDFTKMDNQLISTYHIRFKSDNRVTDAKNMVSTHQKLIPFL